MFKLDLSIERDYTRVGIPFCCSLYNKEEKITIHCLGDTKQEAISRAITCLRPGEYNINLNITESSMCLKSTLQ